MATPTTDLTREIYVERILKTVQPFEKDGQILRKVSKLISIRDVPGYVQVGCLVREANGQVGVSFFIEMNEQQANAFRVHHPQHNIYERNQIFIVIIEWEQYTFLTMAVAES